MPTRMSFLSSACFYIASPFRFSVFPFLPGGDSYFFLYSCLRVSLIHQVYQIRSIIRMIQYIPPNRMKRDLADIELSLFNISLQQYYYITLANEIFSSICCYILGAFISFIIMFVIIYVSFLT